MDKIMEREKAVKTAMSQIERQFGKGSIMKLGAGQLKLCPLFEQVPLLWTKLWELVDIQEAG